MMNEQTTKSSCASALKTADSNKRIRARPGVQEKKQVRFSEVSIRSFDVTCTGIVALGPSIGLDWFYTDGDSQPLDAYEEARAPCRKQSSEDLKLSALQRKSLLMQKHGYSRKDIMLIFQKRVHASRRWAAPPATSQSRSSSSTSSFMTRATRVGGQSSMLQSAGKMFPRSLL